MILDQTSFLLPRAIHINPGFLGYLHLQDGIVFLFSSVWPSTKRVQGVWLIFSFVAFHFTDDWFDPSLIGGPEQNVMYLSIRDSVPFSNYFSISLSLSKEEIDSLPRQVPRLLTCSNNQLVVFRELQSRNAYIFNSFNLSNVHKLQHCKSSFTFMRLRCVEEVA